MYFINRLIKKLLPKNAWSKFYVPLGLLYLLLEREHLVKYNLHSTYKTLPKGTAEEGCVEHRTSDGTGNDLQEPLMGARGTRFGRNFPIDKLTPLDNLRLLEPNPRLISEKLLARKEFIPAKIVNLLAAAWIQFMTHDWFTTHDLNKSDKPIDIPLEQGDDFPVRPMTIEKTQPDSNQDDPRYIAYANKNSHWWDGSQIYGRDRERVNQLRTFENGKLKIQETGLLFIDPSNEMELTGIPDNWWVGLTALHTLFTLEHNAICEMLRKKYPAFHDEKLFQTARLINTALMAKIHTVEWTPAILPNRLLKVAMNVNWYGMLGKKIKEKINLSNYALSGIMGAKANHYGAPFQLTEEFTAVYRLHSLIPDVFDIYSLQNNKMKMEETVAIYETLGKKSKNLTGKYGLTNILYSLGLNYPGALCLHNYPNFLRNLHRQEDGKIIDLAAIDVLRDRERQIPRYNEFRRLLGLNPAKSFEDLTLDKTKAEELKSVYHSIEDVDLLIGCLAEKFPKNYGLGDTAFQIFVLMASRRLMSDRFFTNDYRKEIYTSEGINWVESSTMQDVCVRHCPLLQPAFEKVANAFAPWKKLSAL